LLFILEYIAMLKLTLGKLTLTIDKKGAISLKHTIGDVRLYTPIKVKLVGRSCPLGKEENFNPRNSSWVTQLIQKLGQADYVGLTRYDEAIAMMDAVALVQINAAAIDSFFRDLLNPPTPQPARAKPRFNGGLSGTAIAVRTPPKVRYF
jgi:hypothetical protein